MVAAFVVPYIIIVIVLFIISGAWLFSYSIKAYKDCYKLSQVAKSPVISSFQETFTGGSVIRAFGKEEEFRARNLLLIDKIAVANQVTLGVWGWYSIRLVFLSSLVLMAGCVFCILLRGSV